MSSSSPRISEMRPAIHLQHKTVSKNRGYCELKSGGRQHSLFHHLNVDFGHVHLLRKFRRELGGLQQLCVNRGRHLDVTKWKKSEAKETLWGKDVLAGRRSASYLAVNKYCGDIDKSGVTRACRSFAGFLETNNWSRNNGVDRAFGSQRSVKKIYQGPDIDSTLQGVCKQAVHSSFSAHEQQEEHYIDRWQPGSFMKELCQLRGQREGGYLAFRSAKEPI